MSDAELAARRAAAALAGFESCRACGGDLFWLGAGSCAQCGTLPLEPLPWPADASWVMSVSNDQPRARGIPGLVLGGMGRVRCR